MVEINRTMAVLDDFFPNLLSGFRVAEYHWYMEHFSRLKIYSANPDFYNVHAEYAQLYPQYADRVKPYNEACLHNCSFAYINFLNNAYHFLPALSAHCIPFLITLYPGGGFGLKEPESDAKLKQVINSPLLRGIIVTQSITLEYLRAKGCNVPLHYIYGGAINPVYFEKITRRIGSPSDSDGISICFVAARYMPKGENKGYPQFVEAAKLLSREFSDLRFSVVGNFDKDDVSLGESTKLAISFKGSLTTTELKEFFLTQDIIVSPNRPFLLHPGNFDGFPTGCCVEASLCGVAMVCSDELKLNHHYTDGVDIVITSPAPETIAKAVRDLISNPELLKSIRESGQTLSRDIFDPKIQLGKRSTLLAEALKSSEVEGPNKLLEKYKIAGQVLAHQADHIRVIKEELAARMQNIIGLEATVADQITHISNVEADWAARGQHITNLEQVITDQITHISNVEADWAARGQHITNLEQIITDQITHIPKVEAELMKFRLSWYGRLNAAGQKIKQLLKRI